MEYSNRESLVNELKEAFGYNQDQNNRFNADTNSLTALEVSEVTDSISKQKRFEIALSKEKYRRLLDNEFNFYISTRDNLCYGAEIVFREHENLVPTGRYCIKEISHIEFSKENGGIKSGYCVFSWR